MQTLVSGANCYAMRTHRVAHETGASKRSVLWEVQDGLALAKESSLR